MSAEPRLRGRCQEMARSAQREDPTLRVVRGYFLDLIWGEQPHWWCVRPDGSIVDPSGEQFPSFATATPSCYIEYDGTLVCESCGKEGKEGDPDWEIVGNGHYAVCSDRCHYALVM